MKNHKVSGEKYLSNYLDKLLVKVNGSYLECEISVYQNIVAIRKKIQ